MNMNDNQSIELKQSGINPYHLIVGLSQNETVFKIYELNSNKLYAQRSIESIFNHSKDEIISLFNDTNEAKILFHSTRIILENECYTLIPNDIFQKENIEDFLKFQFEIAPSNNTLFNLISQFETVNVFSIPKSIYLAMSELFPKISIEHHISYYANKILSSIGSSKIFSVIRNQHIDIIVIVHGKLHLINSYSANNKEDIIYHILKTLEFFSIDINRIELHLVFQSKQPELLDKIKEYIKHVTCE